MMTGKSLRKVIQQVLLMYRILKQNGYISSLHLKTQLKSWKTNHFFNDSKRRRVTTSCSKKVSTLLRGTASKNNGNFCLNYGK